MDNFKNLLAILTNEAAKQGKQAGYLHGFCAVKHDASRALSGQSLHLPSRGRPIRTTIQNPTFSLKLGMSLSELNNRT
jgi:hypothetical protein